MRSTAAISRICSKNGRLPTMPWTRAVFTASEKTWSVPMRAACSHITSSPFFTKLSSDSVVDLPLERHRDLLKRGTVLVDERDTGTQPRVLFYLEHSIQDASLTRTGERRVVSKRMLYVELDADGSTRHVQYAT